MLNDSERQQLSLRVEEASLNAWPALHQQLYDGWLLRFSRGFTKRANSVNPLYSAANQTQQPPRQMLEKIRYCENLYSREDQPTIFRLTTLQGHESLESQLTDRGYQRTGESLVLVCPVDDAVDSDPPSTATTTILPGMDDWLDGYCNLADLPPVARTLHQAILKGIHGQLAFAQRTGDLGEPLACGLGVLEAELIGLFDIITAATARRQGHGQRLVKDLLSWGQRGGARYCYLQVAADNDPALALYEDLEFTLLYRYWYRVSP